MRSVYTRSVEVSENAKQYANSLPTLAPALQPLERQIYSGIKARSKARVRRPRPLASTHARSRPLNALGTPTCLLTAAADAPQDSLAQANQMIKSIMWRHTKKQVG